MAYVVSKLGSTGSTLSPEETEQIEKIGGRMIDLELVSGGQWTETRKLYAEVISHSSYTRSEPGSPSRKPLTISSLEA